MDDALRAYFQVILAALATLAVACASLAAAYVVRILDRWRKWEK